MFKTRKIVPIVNLRSEKNRNALSIYFLLHIQFTVVIGLGPILTGDQSISGLLQRDIQFRVQHINHTISSKLRPYFFQEDDAKHAIRHCSHIPRA